MRLRIFFLMLQLAVCLLQIGVGIVCLYWALPLFADPPFLVNGLTREHFALSRLLAENADAAAHLTALRNKLSWLFWRHHEGVLIAMCAGFVLIVSGFAQFILGNVGWRFSPDAARRLG